jgi:hypothetical protein
MILEAIGNGQSLSAISRQDGAPSYSWLKMTLRENPPLRAMYQQACEDRADLLAEEIERLADEEIPADLDGPTMSAWIQRQRLRVDARKWTASKLRPKQWGEKITVDAPVFTVNIRELLDQREKRIQELTMNAITIDHDTL